MYLSYSRQTSAGPPHPSPLQHLQLSNNFFLLHDSLCPQAHNDLSRTYAAKLASFGVAVEDLGFRPMQNVMTNQILGEGPAGLVASPS